MKKLSVALCLTITFSLALLSLSSCLSLGSGVSFFKGKTITLIVPYGKGGGVDTYARAVAPFLQKYLPGSNVLVLNITEDGGLKGKNDIYAAKPDGLTLGFTPVSGALLAEWGGEKGVKYQTSHFSYIGRLNADAHIMVASPRSGYDTLNDFIDAGTIKMGFSGVGSDDYYVALITAQLLGYKVKANKEYLSSSDAGLACVKGDVDAILFSDSSLHAQIIEKTLIPIVAFTAERMVTLPDVPTIFEEVPAEKHDLIMALTQIYGLDRTMIAPPGLPENRLKALRKALDQAVADKEFLQTMDTLKRPINYLSGEEITKILDEILSKEDQIKPLVLQLNQANP